MALTCKQKGLHAFLGRAGNGDPIMEKDTARRRHFRHACGQDLPRQSAIMHHVTGRLAALRIAIADMMTVGRLQSILSMPNISPKLKVMMKGLDTPDVLLLVSR